MMERFLGPFDAEMQDDIGKNELWLFELSSRKNLIEAWLLAGVSFVKYYDGKLSSHVV